MAQTELMIQLLVQVLTLGTLVWGLMKMFSAAREARLARQVAVSASQQAAEAARTAAKHGAEAIQVVTEVAATVRDIQVATNGMQAALLDATQKAAFASGQQAERDKR